MVADGTVPLVNSWTRAEAASPGPRVDDGGEAADDVLVDQPVDPPLGRRHRQADGPADLRVGRPAVLQQVLDDLHVELVGGHRVMVASTVTRTQQTCADAQRRANATGLARPYASPVPAEPETGGSSPWYP